MLLLALFYSFVLFIVGIPLLYFYLLYTSKDMIGTKDFDTNIACWLCEDYATECWYVLLDNTWTLFTFI